MNQGLSALESLYKEWDHSMVQDFRKKDFRGSFTTAKRLLEYADLPLLYRARALTILATRRREDSVSLAEEAVRLIDEDVRQLVQEANEPFPLEELSRAQSILTIAREEAAIRRQAEIVSVSDAAATALQASDANAQSVAVLTQDISDVSLEGTTTVSTSVASEDQLDDAESSAV